MANTEYGYIGATPTQDMFSGNSGMFGVNDVVELIEEDKYRVGSDLFHIQTINASSQANIDFTNIHNTRFNTHLIVYDGLRPTGDNEPLALRLRQQSNSTFFTSGYKVAVGEMYSNNFGAYRGSKNFLRIAENTGNQSYENANGFVWIHGAGDSESYTDITAQSTCVWNNATEIGLLGGGFLKNSAVIDGFRLYGENTGTTWTGRVALYGVTGQ